jgi:aminopeptidase 2
MCRHQFGTDIDGSATDISHGRQVLPTNVKPIHYDLTLEPDFEIFRYEGKVVIE